MTSHTDVDLISKIYIKYVIIISPKIKTEKYFKSLYFWNVFYSKDLRN